MAIVDLSPFNAVLERLERAADRIEAGIGAGGAGGAAPAAAAAAAPPADDPAIAIAFDEFVKEKVAPIEAAAKDSGVQDLTEATETYVGALRCLRGIIVASGKCKKPKDTDWGGILKPVMELGGKAQKACDNRSEYFQNRKSVAEALNVVTMAMQGSPPSHVQNVLESMDFHGMKVMQKKNDKETAWIKALKASLTGLKEWANENCKLGLVWSANGQDPVPYFAGKPLSADAASAAAPAAAAPGKGGGKGKAPPPPKGGFAVPTEEQKEKMRGGGAGGAATANGGGGGGGMNAVFDAINKLSGTGLGGLKKVTDDMKTKNQKIESKVPAAAAKAPAPSAKAGGLRGPRGPPIMELQKDTNWMIENYDGVKDLVIEDVTMQQLVCIINCRNATVTIKNKVKSLCIDGCEKVNVICGDVLSAVELVNCERCQVQTTGQVNAFAIDKCNGVNVYLSKESMKAEFTTAKSSEMNITFPNETGDEMIECPIPEQFVTTIAGPKKLKTEVSAIYS